MSMHLWVHDQIARSFSFDISCLLFRNQEMECSVIRRIFLKSISCEFPFHSFRALSLWSSGHVVSSNFVECMPCIWCILLCKHCKSKDPLLRHISLILFSVLHQLPVSVRYVDLLMRVLSPPSNHGDIIHSPRFIIQPVIVQMPTQCTGVQRSSTFKDTSDNYSSSRGTQSKKTNLNVVLCKNKLIQQADNQLVVSRSW